MKIVVCIKQVGFVYYPAAVDLATGEIDLGKIVFMLNPYDEVAVEEAISIREQVANSEVVIITAGGPETEKALRYAFAMGADRMIRINYVSADSWSTSLALSVAIEKNGYDMVFCGKKAIDSNGNQMGSFIAERLQIPQVSGIVSMDLAVSERKVIVERYLGKGDREEVECDLPALFTVEMALNDPRYPTLPKRFAAEKKVVEIIDPKALGISPEQEVSLTEIRKISLPRPKTRKVFTPDSSLSAADRIKQMMSGGAKSREAGDVLEGTPEELAGHIVKFLVQEKVV